MTRAVLRYVRHRIIRHPDIEPEHQAKCSACGWASELSTTDAEAVDLACMQHTGRSGHTQFSRSAAWVAFVVREE
ncbi:hypothetical protein AB0I77_26995 [Streptomyces sp. NPDC050619]|uniref:DUF7848 domain-containing protein n=1 Tax=Streptomyces sp. NPDC050619 TaxID=3157214 RepID=UPI003436FBC5